MAVEAVEAAMVAEAAAGAAGAEGAVRFGGAAVASDPAHHACFCGGAEMASWSGLRMTAERLVRLYRKPLGKGDNDCHDEVEA